MIRNIFLLSSLMILMSLPLSAQHLEVIKGNVDCGNVAYEKPVKAVFELKNKSRHKVRITNVETSCGCVSVDYPHGDIDGREAFTVQLTYDARMLGHFYKTALVTYKGSDEPIELVMKGKVLTEVQDNSADYPYAFGKLLTDKNMIEFDDVSKGENQEQDLLVYNNGSETLEPNLLHLPSYITTKVMPEHLKPGKAGKITLYLNSSKLRSYGLTQSKVNIAGKYGEKVSEETEIPVSVVLTPDLEMTEAEMLNAPKLSLSTENIEVDFQGKSKKRYDILLSNTGRTTLNITSLQMFTEGMKVTLSKRHIEPGETAKLKVTAYSNAFKKTKSRPRILMITNDPKKSKVIIELKVVRL